MQGREATSIDRVDVCTMLQQNLDTALATPFDGVVESCRSRHVSIIYSTSAPPSCAPIRAAACQLAAVSQLRYKRASHIPVHSPLRVPKIVFDSIAENGRIKDQAKRSRSMVPEGEAAWM